MDFLVDRQDLRRCRFVSSPPPRVEPGSGQALLRVEAFGFTANNVTYGVVGDMIGYWKFFPAEEGWGRIPVWGIGVVEDPGTSGLTRGERIYGYLPMSTHLVVIPTQVSERGFVDATPHRQELPPLYNQYTRLSGDPSYDPRYEDRMMLLWPLFATGFLLDDFFADNGFFGARSVVLASASSKTALSCAWNLKRRGACRVVGLTSPANVAFVERVGCYDQVLAYGSIAKLPKDEPIVLVDMAGNAEVITAVHRHLGDGVKYSSQVGVTHWEKLGGVPEDLPGAKPELFFAPGQIEKRNREWGPGGLQTRMAEAWRTFLGETEGWLRIIHKRGPEAVEAVYRDGVEGRIKPDEGLILSLHETQPAARSVG
ncbi:MAG TPA: DUF2855 family protein [Candidatus Binatia bacterium]